MIAPAGEWKPMMGRNHHARIGSAVGMTFAVNSDVLFNAGRGEETWVPQADTFTQLDEADREVLSDWLVRAEGRGIDTVMDLGVRPWNIAGARVVFGVFETNKDQASWLVVRDGSAWTLARCADGYVSDMSTSLPDILALIDLDPRA